MGWGGVQVHTGVITCSPSGAETCRVRPHAHTSWVTFAQQPHNFTAVKSLYPKCPVL